MQCLECCDFCEYFCDNGILEEDSEDFDGYCSRNKHEVDRMEVCKDFSCIACEKCEEE